MKHRAPTPFERRAYAPRNVARALRRCAEHHRLTAAFLPADAPLENHLDHRGWENALLRAADMLGRADPRRGGQRAARVIVIGTGLALIAIGAATRAATLIIAP